MEALLIGRQEVSGKKKNNTESPKNEGKERREVAVWKEGVANKTIISHPIGLQSFSSEGIWTL